MQESINNLTKQLKIRLMVMFQRKGDEKVLVTKGRSFTGNEMASEIEKETEVGVHYIETALALTVDLLARDKMNYDEEREKLDKEKELLFIQRLGNGTIQVEAYGDNSQLSQIVYETMAGDLEIASAICAAIPSFLDKVGKTRESYCEMVMSSKGLKN